MVVSRRHAEKAKYMLHTLVETSKCFCRQGNCFSHGIFDDESSTKWRCGSEFETL